MPKDRLSEFQARRDEVDTADSSDSDLQVLSMTLPGLFDKVNPIDKKLKILKSQVDQVRRIQKDVNVSPFVEAGDLRKMESIAEEIMSSSAQIRREIESIRDVDVRTDAQSRVKALQTDRLFNELRTIMNDFRSNQAEYLSSSKARINRQMLITGLSPSDVTINMSYENPSVFTGGFLQEAQEAKSDLQEIKEREKNLNDLEKQIHEINGLFKEMHLLVSEQGEKLDTIEDNVNNAKEHVDKGKNNLRQAVEYTEKSRKTCIIIAFIVTVTVVLLVIILSILGALNVI
ncbi:hypothetical protein FSP39_024123 [Pinctada imbricata]|uniref:t-SNARE coiled-coil homology domain-containing protein n=1 Tax=Pinctada imbricata TaxID=66713 RepID=A0AA89BV27_PINIB|nr:hypothetical protein FSP39_024123 [Pinctada imbricata]